MKPKQTLVFVLTLVLTAEAIPELIMDNFEVVTAVGCIAFFGLMVYAIKKRPTQ